MNEGAWERYKTLYRLAKEQRRLQKEYFRTRDKDILSQCRAAEQDIDTILRTIEMFDRFNIPNIAELQENEENWDE